MVTQCSNHGSTQRTEFRVGSRKENIFIPAHISGCDNAADPPAFVGYPASIETLELDMLSHSNTQAHTFQLLMLHGPPRLAGDSVTFSRAAHPSCFELYTSSHAYFFLARKPLSTALFTTHRGVSFCVAL